MDGILTKALSVQPMEVAVASAVVLGLYLIYKVLLRWGRAPPWMPQRGV